MRTRAHPPRCRWAISGEARARQCLLYRGILPLVANKPSAADAVDATDRQLEFALQHVRTPVAPAAQLWACLQALIRVLRLRSCSHPTERSTWTAS
jgi:hypothetical protein